MTKTIYPIHSEDALPKNAVHTIIMHMAKEKGEQAYYQRLGGGWAVSLGNNLGRSNTLLGAYIDFFKSYV